MEYHGNLLSTQFFNKEFLKKFKILEKRKSLDNPWIHYLVSIAAEELEKTITEIQKHLFPQKYYAHLYNEDGSNIIVIFPQKIFRLNINNQEGWKELHDYMITFGIPESQTDPNPKKFQDEKDYYSKKPLVEE